MAWHETDDRSSKLNERSWNPPSENELLSRFPLSMLDILAGLGWRASKAGLPHCINLWRDSECSAVIRRCVHSAPPPPPLLLLLLNELAPCHLGCQSQQKWILTKVKVEWAKIPSHRAGDRGTGSEQGGGDHVILWQNAELSVNWSRGRVMLPRPISSLMAVVGVEVSGSCDMLWEGGRRTRFQGL